MQIAVLSLWIIICLILGLFNAGGWIIFSATAAAIIVCALTNRFSANNFHAEIQSTNFSQNKSAHTNLKIYGDGSKFECILVLRNCLTNTEKTIKLKSTADKKGTDFDIDIKSDFCGKIEFEFLDFKKYDLIGLTYKKINVEINGYCTCQPEMTKDELGNNINKAMQTINSDNNFLSEKSGKERSDFMGVREYKSGDSFKDIHWKLSFKQGDIIIKEYSSNDEIRLCLYLETGCPEGTDNFKEFDSLAKKIISLSNSLLSNEQTHFVALKNQKTSEEYFDKVDSFENFLVAKAHILNANPKVALPSFDEFRDKFSTFGISSVEYFVLSEQEVPVDENIILWRNHN